MGKLEDNNKKKDKKVASILDIERLLPRILRGWYIFVISLFLAFCIAFVLNNWYFTKVYRVNTTFNVASGGSQSGVGSNSINFIWGGSSSKINTLMFVMQSRTHNEEVARRSGAYVYYYEEGRVKKSDRFKLDAPFIVTVDTTHAQTIGAEIIIKKINETSFEIKPLSSEGSLYDYRKDSIMYLEKVALPNKANFGQWITVKGFRFKVNKSDIAFNPSAQYSFVLVTLGQATSRVMGGLVIDLYGKGSSIVTATKSSGSLNESTYVLNTSIKVLQEQELVEKNLAAIKTKEYIKKQMGIVKDKVDSTSTNLQMLQKKEKVYDFEGEKGNILSSIIGLETERIKQEEKIKALNTVSSNVNSGANNLIALSVTGLDESLFSSGLQELRSLEEQRRNALRFFQSDSEEVELIDQNTSVVKNRLQTVISTHRNKVNRDLDNINSKIANFDSKANKLPKQEKEFLDANRGYHVNDQIYTGLMTALSQAELSIASSISDIKVIDAAKVMGQGPIFPDHKTNYMISFGLAILLPFLYFVLRELFDTKVKTIKDITDNTAIPLLGAVGVYEDPNPLVVINSPKSAISESFRTIRSNLKFILKRKESEEKNQTFLVTSFIGGEGKTFISMNIASVLALSGKKTILVGMDLRKPKIFDSFEIKNTIGLTNYLAGDATEKEIIQKTKIKELDVITAGPIPPNPSELLLTDKVRDFIQRLKLEYDYVVLDTPPIGLVADAYDLMKYVDATLYVTRYDYSEKDFIVSISTMYEEGEISNVGVILNSFEVKSGYGYGYGYGYFEEDSFYSTSIIERIKKIFNKYNKKYNSRSRK